MRRVLSLILGLLPAAGAVGVAPVSIAHAEPVAEEIPGEEAVYARFSDLADGATEFRLEVLLADPFLKESMVALANLLDAGATAAELEGKLLPLIAKQTVDEANTTLAAVMLDQYLTFVRPELANGSLGISDVFDELIARDATLTTAAFGPGPRRGPIRR